MKVVIFSAGSHEAPIFASLQPANELRLVADGLTAGNVADYAAAQAISTSMHSDLSPAVLEKLPMLKLLAVRSTGYDHVDLALCNRRGITVCNVPRYGENTVAEHVFALLLAVSHRLPEAMERARSGQFSPEGLEGFDLAGKTLGVVGTGNIGRRVIPIARGFGMTVIAFDRRPDAQFAERLGFRYAGFSELLPSADIITLHVPASPETTHILSAAAFARMKDGVVIINTARGELIDSAALIDALHAGKVAAAGLDVLPEEPLIREEVELIGSLLKGKHDLSDLLADHVLLRLPNVVVTPHSAFFTREALRRILQTTADNIRAFSEGKPNNVVNEPSRL